MVHFQYEGYHNYYRSYGNLSSLIYKDKMSCFVSGDVNLIQPFLDPYHGQNITVKVCIHYTIIKQLFKQLVSSLTATEVMQGCN